MALNYKDEFITWLPGQEWLVEEILEQDKNKFLVKWKGWDEKFNTWEPRENVESWEGFYKFECERAKKHGQPMPARGVRGGIKKCKRTLEKHVSKFFNHQSKLLLSFLHNW